MKQLLLAMGASLMVGTPVFALPGFKYEPDFRHEFFQNTPITGKITNDQGEPLAGVTVQVKGTAKSVLTGADGTFSMDASANAGTLVISYVGMESQEIKISGNKNFQVQLKPSANTMSDVVVVGYGTQKRANLTGSVASVNGQTLTQRPAPNAANMLQGRLTGVQVTQPSAEPGRDNANILIRGRGSFGGATAPLILIDGVAGNINNLSPDNIENVTVLKDAASASIYGSRAANGVILVTTKKGRKGQTTLSYRANVARHVPTAQPDFITNSAEYMELYNMAAIRSGIAFKYDSLEILKYKNATDRVTYPNFDFVDYYIRPATVTNHSLSVSGGSEKNTFNLSLGYLDQEAVIPGYKYKRYNALLNYSSQLNKIVTVGTVMNLTYKDRKEPPFTGENLTLTIYAAGPTYGPFLPDGSGRIASRAYFLEGRNRNPQEAYAMGWQNAKEYNVNAQAYMDVRVMKGLTWSSKVAVNYVDEFYKMYQHPYNAYVSQERDAATNDYRAYTFGPDILGVTDQYSKTISPTIYSTLTYDTRIADDHNLRVLAGYEQLYSKFQTLRGRRINTVAPVLEELTGYANTSESLFFTHPRLPGLTAPYEWALQSLFGRVNYDYKGKYLLEGNLRYDGTSRVSPGYRWGLFPSVSAGWLASQEDFIRDNFNWINTLKLRASYGTLGNQDISFYSYQNTINIGVVYPFGNTTATQGGVINTYNDQSIQWESTKIADYGFDLSAWKGLLGVSFDWFEKTSFDILATPLVPASIGISSSPINNGKLRNRGIELELTHQNHIGAVNYGVNAQVSTAKNKVLDIKVPSKGTSIREIGQPFDAHYLYVWDGIFQVENITDPKVPKHALNTNPKPGDLKMKDIDGDGDVDANDRVVVKGAYPDYMYSGGFNVGYKGFNLSAFFQGVEGLKNRVNNWAVDPFQQGTPPTTKWRNAWTAENRSNTLPGIYVAGYSGVAAYGGSTYYLMDASYLRVKNVNLSYTFPKGMISRFRASDLTVYVSADNLYTFTNYEGGDPERAGTSGNFAQFPQAKIFNAGLNVKF